MKQASWAAAVIAALAIVFAVAALVDGGGGSGPGSAAPAELLARPHAPTLGNKDARVHIVEFLDPACEACRAFYPLVKELLRAEPGRIRLSIRHVAFHEGADFAVKVLEAAGKQGKYWPVLEALLASQPDWAINHKVRPELVWKQLAGLGLDLERLRKDMDDPETLRNMKLDDADAVALRVMKTPEYFVNGRRLPKFGRDELRQLVQDELARSY